MRWVIATQPVQPVTSYQVDAPTNENAAPAPAETIVEEPEAEANANAENTVRPDLDHRCHPLNMPLRNDHTRCTYSERGSEEYHAVIPIIKSFSAEKCTSHPIIIPVSDL